jgi:hypothetical protein
VDRSETSTIFDFHRNPQLPSYAGHAAAAIKG